MKKLHALHWLFCAICVCYMQSGLAQVYAPSAGQQGSSAMYKDSSAFVAWVSACTVNRGWQDISTPSLGLTTGGDVGMVLGKADVAGVLSLGDGGSAICTFQNPISNGPGYDFAVFENSFNDDFLELAFVEVSSDGKNFVRFSAHSLSDTLNQCGTFGSTDASKVNNLAGKYRGGFGTPFDLQELSGIQGLDISRISHVKIVDVVGAVDPLYAQRDAHRNKINDPWPTPFPSGGFDLDAIGVMHQAAPNALDEQSNESRTITLFPNPSQGQTNIQIMGLKQNDHVDLLNACGVLLDQIEGNSIDASAYPAGLYLVKLQNTFGTQILKLLLN